MSLEPRQRHPDESPFTLDEAEESLAFVEEVATLERDMGEATRFILGSLLFELAESGAFDGRAFIARLRAGLDQLNPPTRCAAEVLLGNMQLQWPGLSDAPAPGAPGPRAN